MKGTMDYYNRTASSWAVNGYDPESEIPALLDFVKRFPSGSRFLDLCCGCGYDSARIHTLGYGVIGIDFSAESLRIARERNPDITFFQENILNDYSYVGRMDGIVVIAGLVHIETSDLRQAFSRMRNVLKKHGQVFVTIWEGLGKSDSRSLTVIDGVAYDRNFICHTLEELITASAGLFSFIEEAATDDCGWRHFIFRCI